MALRLEAVTFDVADATGVASFWARLLDREVLTESSGALVPGSKTQVGLRFVTSDTEQGGPRQLHLHLTSSSLETSSYESKGLRTSECRNSLRAIREFRNQTCKQDAMHHPLPGETSRDGMTTALHVNQHAAICPRPGET